MKLRLIREPSVNGATLGCLFVDRHWQCHTLEDELREVPGVSVSAWKVPGATAIPAGRYSIVIDPSERFHRLMPHILNVPGFDGIRLHSGNVASQTEGCVLVGLSRGVDSVLQSQLAFGPLFDKLKKATTPIEIVIENPDEAA